MNPTISGAAGIYYIAWDEEGILLRADRLRESKDDVTAEITVRQTAPVQGHLHQARLNLTSTAARKTLAKALNERLVLDWDTLIEQACVLVLRRHREGEPAVRVGRLPLPTAPAYVLYPIVRRGEPTILYGPGGVGKSILAAFFALLTEAGVAWAGVSPSREPALYLDYEATQEDLNWRVLALGNGLGLPETPELLYRRCYLPLALDLEAIREIVMEHKTSFCIVDSLGLACGGEPEKPGAVLPVFAALRSLNVTALILHHIPKDVERAEYGSVYIRNMARSSWEVKRSQEPGENIIQVGVYHRKANNTRLQRPLGFTIEFGSEDESPRIRVSSVNVLHVPLLAAGSPLWLRLKDALSHEQRNTRDLAEELGEREDTIRARLNDYKAIFRRYPTGLWGVLSHEE